jgi:hypothetical protein
MLIKDIVFTKIFASHIKNKKNNIKKTIILIDSIMLKIVINKKDIRDSQVNKIKQYQTGLSIVYTGARKTVLHPPCKTGRVLQMTFNRMLCMKF